MKKIDGKWTDEKGNEWYGGLTKEQAIAFSESLIDCSHCSDCSRCYDCSDWSNNPQRITSPKIGSRKSQTKEDYSAMNQLPEIVKAIVWTVIGIAVGILISGVIYQLTLP